MKEFAARLTLAKTMLEGKVAVVTGGSRGLGAAVVSEFLGQGAKVATIARTAVHEQTPVLLSRSGDVSRTPDVAKFASLVLEHFGHVDIIVNNAAVLLALKPLHEFDEGEWRQTLNVNLSGAFMVIRHFVPVMASRGTGVILNVSSSVGQTPTATWGPYAIAKAGLDYMTKLLAVELGDYGIRVLTIAPRRLRTAMRSFAHPTEDPSGQLDPQTVAPIFAFAASDECDLSGEYLDLATWNPVRT